MIGEKRVGGYTLFYDFDALCEAEKEVGPIGKALARLNEGSLSDIRALTWAGLRRHHADVLLEKTGAIVMKIGFEPLAEAIGEAVQEAFGTQDQSAEGKAKRRAKPTG